MPPNAFSYDVGYENIVVTLLLIPVTAKRLCNLKLFSHVVGQDSTES